MFGPTCPDKWSNKHIFLLFFLFDKLPIVTKVTNCKLTFFLLDIWKSKLTNCKLTVFFLTIFFWQLFLFFLLDIWKSKLQLYKLQIDKLTYCKLTIFLTIFFFFYIFFSFFVWYLEKQIANWQSANLQIKLLIDKLPIANFFLRIWILEIDKFQLQIKISNW